MKKKRRKRKIKKPKERSAIVLGMILRSQKAGAHKDKKKEASRKACRKPVK
jgi:hypothetical protein